MKQKNQSPDPSGAMSCKKLDANSPGAMQLYKQNASSPGVMQVKKQNARSPLMKLPKDVFLLIADELPLHAIYFLAQTCRDIRSILHRDWHEIINTATLPLIERLRFLFGLSYVLPDYHMCSCYEMHKIDLQDVPSHRLYRRDRCTNFELRHYNYWNGFKVAFHHVQLSLKYTRLKGTQDEYLKRLMAPIRHRHPLLPAPLTSTCIKTPRIIDGRYILQTVIKIVGVNPMRDEEFWARLKRFRTMSLCRHNDVSRTLRAAREKTKLCEEAFENALSPLALTVADLPASCTDCRTDYLVQLQQGEWTFASWQEMGTESELGIQQDDRLATRCCWRGEDFMLWESPQTPHVLGEIEALWSSGSPPSAFARAMQLREPLDESAPWLVKTTTNQ